MQQNYSKRRHYNCTGIHHRARQISNKKHNITLKGTRKTKTKTKPVERKKIKINQKQMKFKL